MTSAELQHESRTKFLDASLHVIRTKGYSATRVEDVCAVAGLTKGSFFHHFKSKEEMALAAAEHFSNKAESLFKIASYRELQDPVDRLLGYVDFRKAILRGNLPEFTCLLGTMVQEAYETNPAIREACDRYISLHANAVRLDVLKAMEKYPENRDWTDRSLAYYTQAVVQGSFILAKAKRDPEIAIEMLDHLHRYIELLFPRPTTSRPATAQPDAA
jgi:TetR/AcrR family transcriptional regulator, transcriptional repressor for nem operon